MNCKNIFNVINLETVDSTNNFAKEKAADISLPVLITAQCQTAGRGRHGKSFYSPESTGLYMTLLVETSPEKAEMLTLFTPAAAVAVCEAIEAVSALKPEIKWVNDVFLGGKKCCGILTERFSANKRTFTAIGIGINITTEIFPNEIDAFACSLNTEINKEALSFDIADRLLDYYENENNKRILNEYEKRLFVIGKRAVYKKNGESFYATVNGINEMCNLLVTRDDGKTDILSSGEISIVLCNEASEKSQS